MIVVDNNNNNNNNKQLWKCDEYTHWMIDDEVNQVLMVSNGDLTFSTAMGTLLVKGKRLFERHMSKNKEVGKHYEED